MIFTESVMVKKEHIDFQNILDNIYYSYYFENTRHKCFHELTGLSVEELAEEGINAVLLKEYIDFKKPIRETDQIQVTCEFKAMSKVKFIAEQSILINDNIASKGYYEITCVKASGGRPFLPDLITSKIV